MFLFKIDSTIASLKGHEASANNELLSEYTYFSPFEFPCRLAQYH